MDAKTDAKTDAKKKTGTLTVGNKNWDFPVYDGTIGPDVLDIAKLYNESGMFTYDPGFTSTASCVRSAIRGRWNSINDFGILDTTSFSQESSANDAAAEALRQAPARTVLLDDGVHDSQLAEIAHGE